MKWLVICNTGDVDEQNSFVKKWTVELAVIAGNDAFCDFLPNIAWCRFSFPDKICIYLKIECSVIIMVPAR